jgi:hypothetical protein
LDAIVDPPFICEPNWLDDTTTSILKYFNAKDEGAERVPPMALVRCSRGGKSRSLRELACLLKTTLPDVAVIFVSLNDFSTLRPWENNDQIGALCRRIAFYSLKDHVHYLEFEYENVQKDTILSWLGTSKCVLLIDELNKFSLNDSVVQFLKENFLMRAGRYFVFSSHLFTTTTQLSQFMETNSGRGVIIRAMPLITSVDDVSKILNYDVSMGVAFFCGLIPALIYLYQRGGLTYPVDKRDQFIRESAAQLTESAVRRLLSTFITGDPDGFPVDMKQLLQGMDTRGEKDVIWIPMHMTATLKHFARESQPLSRDFADVLVKIPRHYELFAKAKDDDGQGWEHFFIITLLIRVLSNRYHTLLPIPHDFHNCTVSYNYFCGSLDDVKTSNGLLRKLKVPSQLPHIVVYVPTHATFELYDVIVVTYGADKDRGKCMGTS